MADLGLVLGAGGIVARRDRLVGIAVARSVSAGRARQECRGNFALHAGEGILRFNQLYPPFDNPAARRALLSAIDQNEAMIALAGDDPADRYDGVGIFATGTPLANDAGIEVMTRPRDYAAAKKALAEAGYKGEKIVIISPTDVPGIRELSI